MKEQTNYSPRGLVPHPWDEWFHERIMPVVQNSQGEDVSLDTGKTSLFSWGTRNLTNNCKNCPLFIPPTATETVVRALKSYRTFRKLYVPQDLGGICIFSDTGYQRTIPKFLVGNDTTEKRLKSCSSGDSKRMERAAKKRERGELVATSSDTH